MLKFLPDSEVITPEVLTDVSNSVPTFRGYAGFPTGNDSGLAAVSENVTGAALCVDLNGDATLFVGTDDTLQKAGTSTWTDVSDTSYATGYNASTARWRFTQFGNTTLAIAASIQLQKYTVGDTDFAKVANAPKANYIETGSGFVLLADCDDTDTGLSTGYGDQGNRWWCSQIFAPTSTWAPDVSTQATTGLLADSPGPITGLARLGSDIIAFKKTALHVGTYVGPPVVWQWRRVPGDVGCATQESAVSIGTAVLFVGEDDIYYFDGSVPQSIGAGIKEWFFNERLNKKFATAIWGIHDQINGRVMWAYPSGTDGTLNNILVYNYRSQSWGHATLTIQAFVRAVTGGVIYKGTNDFEDAIAALSGDSTPEYNDIPATLPYKSDYFAAGNPIPSYVGTDKKVYQLAGIPSSWSLTTGDVGDPDGFSLLRKVRPRWRTRPTTASLVHRVRDDLGDSPTELASTSINNDRFDVLRSARWHSWRMTCTGVGEVEAFKGEFVPQGFE